MDRKKGDWNRRKTGRDLSKNLLPVNGKLLGIVPSIFSTRMKIHQVFFRAGDKVRFYSISMKEHQEISEQIKTRTFKLK